MKEQGRPTLTLRRKTEPEGQRAINNSEPDGVGPGRVTRKKTVVVNTTPAWKVRKQAVDESAKKAQADEKAARKAEKARQWAERQAQEREAMRAARRKPAPEPVYRKARAGDFREDAETLPCRRHPLGCVSGRHDGGRVA